MKLYLLFMFNIGMISNKQNDLDDYDQFLLTMYKSFPYKSKNLEEQFGNTNLNYVISNIIESFKLLKDKGDTFYTILNIVDIKSRISILENELKIPTEKDIDDLKETIEEVKKRYEQQRINYNFFNRKWWFKNSKSHKLKEDLLEDNNKDVVKYDRRFDKTVSNMKLLEKIVDEEFQGAGLD